MKKFSLLTLAAAALFFTACQSENKEENNQEAALDTNIVSATTQNCYAYAKNGDTAKLTFMTSGDITTGELLYKLAEKDSNKGIIKGKMHGDTLLADYTFNSEGTESVRQVAFIKRGDDLLEGFGDVEQRDGKMVFKNTGKLTFGQSIVFKKVDCQ